MDGWRNKIDWLIAFFTDRLIDWLTDWSNDGKIGWFGSESCQQVKRETSIANEKLSKEDYSNPFGGQKQIYYKKIRYIVFVKHKEIWKERKKRRDKEKKKQRKKEMSQNIQIVFQSSGTSRDREHSCHPKYFWIFFICFCLKGTTSCSTWCHRMKREKGIKRNQKKEEE